MWKQTDGNFVLYQTSTMAVIWVSFTAASPNPPGYVIPVQAVMQTDGNLVLLDGNNNFRWGSYQNMPGYKLVANSFVAVEGPVPSALTNNNYVVGGIVPAISSPGLVQYPPNSGRYGAYVFGGQYNWACNAWTCQGPNY